MGAMFNKSGTANAFKALFNTCFPTLLNCRAVLLENLGFGITWESFWPGFAVALAGTLKVFAIGFAGFILVRKRWLAEAGLQSIGQLVALLTLPCMIVHRFATQFNPVDLPDWWKYALMGAGVTIGGMLLGAPISWRHNDNNEATMLVGFQNAGFFVLPMLQALLPPDRYEKASLLLFVFVIPFNSALWFTGSTLLLRKKSLDPRTILTPPLVATLGSVTLYALFHDWLHSFDSLLLMRVLLGGGSDNAVGAIQLVGDLTVPLATIMLGGSIAASLRGPLGEIQYKRAALQVTFVKMIVYPLLGFFLIRYFIPQVNGSVVALLLILEFAAPPAMNLPVFARQHGYPMRYIPTACLLSYIVCLITVPFFAALVL